MSAPGHKAALAAIIGEMATLYEKRLSGDEVELTVRELVDFEPADVARACREIVRTHDRWPRVSHIRTVIVEHALNLPTEEEALAQVERRIAVTREANAAISHSPLSPVDVDRLSARAHVHPLVKQAVDHIGGYAGFRTADEPTVVRGQFLRLYRDLRSAEVRRAQVGRPAPPALPPGQHGRLS